MYQYGNVAVKYQDPQRRKAKAHIPTSLQPQQSPQPQESPKTRQLPKQKTRTSPASKPRLSQMTALEKGAYLLFVITIIAVLSLLIAQNATISRINYEIQSSQNEMEQIQKQNATLETEVTALSSPERIIEIATTELGMKAEGSKVKILSERSR